MAVWVWRKKWLAADKDRLGAWGEKQALKLLRRKGHTLIARNFRCKSGEIDIITADARGVIVFTEVKTRRNENFIAAHKVVTWPKQKRIIRTAKYFAKKFKIKGRPMRFDVIAVVLDNPGKERLRHYERAFRPRY